MTDREMLIELLRDVQYLGGLEEKIADHLLANGVAIGKKERFLYTENGDVIPLDRRWIPVTERVPNDDNERVLVFTKGNAPIGNQRMDTDRYRRGEWVRYGGNVTHWMPLPEPPKEET